MKSPNPFIRLVLDLIHYLIGLILVALALWGMIQLHTYFSQNNISIAANHSSTTLDATTLMR